MRSRRSIAAMDGEERACGSVTNVGVVAVSYTAGRGFDSHSAHAWSIGRVVRRQGVSATQVSTRDRQAGEVLR